ncbi:unnamed protein product [Nezara viridula]|uniref:Uncharacterized protein n=1 Tax=Nezara viridula TaxID=85310 RepID=A0A9P0HFB3_NEZVI|nr:unnamed protein product [Nezara viridula]
MRYYLPEEETLSAYSWMTSISMPLVMCSGDTFIFSLCHAKGILLVAGWDAAEDLTRQLIDIAPAKDTGGWQHDLYKI